MLSESSINHNGLSAANPQLGECMMMNVEDFWRFAQAHPPSAEISMSRFDLIGVLTGSLKINC
jgi:hypothetical protein